MKFSFCTIAWRNSKMTIEEMIYIVGMLGYDGIEIWREHLKGYETALDSLGEQLNHFNLEVPMISPYFDFTSTKSKWDKSVILGEQSLQLAKVMNCSLIRCFTGQVGSDFVTEKQRNACVDALQILADKGRDLGIKLAIETHIDTLADKVHSTKQLIEDINRENVGINLDIFNLYENENGMSIMEMINELYPMTIHVHAKNAEKNVGRISPFNFVMQKGRRVGGIRNLNEGDLNYDKIIFDLLKRDYSSYFSVECFETMRNPIRVAKDEIEYLRKAKKRQELKLEKMYNREMHNYGLHRRRRSMFPARGKLQFT